jgi:hypothetical protein
MRLSARIAWKLAVPLSAISRTFTWYWATWWTAALIRFATTDQAVTVRRADGTPL